jgi:hypothetical protein
MTRTRGPVHWRRSPLFIGAVGAISMLLLVLAVAVFDENDIWGSIAGAASVPLALVFVASLLEYWEEKRSSKFSDMLVQALRHGELTRSSPLSARKRELLQSMGPQTYYYLDPHQIEDLYAQITTEPSSIEVEEQRSRSTGIAAKLKFLEPRYDRGSTVRRLEKYEGNKAASQKYQLIQREMLTRQELVTFGIEDFEYDSDAVHEVRTALENVELPEPLFREILTEVSMRKRLEAAHRKRDELKNVSGFVATHADYVARWHTERECSLYLQHPLNDYVKGEHPEVVIKIVCNPDFLTPSGRDAFIEGALIRITCLGKVIRWHPQSAHLVISPIGIS